MVGDTPWNIAKPSLYTSALRRLLHVCDQRKGRRKCNPDAGLDAARDATIAKDGTLMSHVRGNIEPLPPSILDRVSSWGEEIARHGQKSRWMCGYEEARRIPTGDMRNIDFLVSYPAALDGIEGECGECSVFRRC